MSETQATEAENPTDLTAGDEPTSATTTPITERPVTGDADLSVEAAESESDDDADDDAGDGDGDGGDAETAKADKGDKKSRVRQLEREGEVAADFLETLLDIADLDGDIDVDVDGDRAAIAIVDSDEGRVPRRLVGADGKVLEALQELTRLAVQAETGERSRLMLDIAGHRAQRRSALVELAKVAIAEVKESGTKRSLEPMSAFERKVVHDEVAAAGLVSESEGVDPHRHIVILPA
jgi:spoIIIJ-associated protein